MISFSSVGYYRLALSVSSTKHSKTIPPGGIRLANRVVCKCSLGLKKSRGKWRNVANLADPSERYDPGQTHFARDKLYPEPQVEKALYPQLLMACRVQKVEISQAIMPAFHLMFLAALPVMPVSIFWSPLALYLPQAPGWMGQAVSGKQLPSVYR